MKNAAWTTNGTRFWDKVFLLVRPRGYYVPPVLAEYKQREFLRRLDQWAPEQYAVGVKTDLFEEAFGYTSIHEWLRRHGRLVVGIDISQQIASLSGENGGVLIAADIARIPLKACSVDFVFSSSTFGYLEDPLQGLREAYRVLKPGATMIISVNNRCNVLFRITSFLSTLSGGIRFPLSRFYYPGEFKALLEHAGFTVKDCEAAVHIFPGYNTLVGLLSQRRGRLSEWVLGRLLAMLDTYSRWQWFGAYLTGWFTVYKAEKRSC